MEKTKVQADEVNGVYVVAEYDPEFLDHVVTADEFCRWLSGSAPLPMAAELSKDEARKVHEIFGIAGWKNPAAVALGQMGGKKKSEAKSEAARANAAKPRTKRAAPPTLANQQLSISVRNSQGASDGMVGTPSEINRWLRDWNDPENLSATVTDEHGAIIAEKPTGRKTIKW